MKKLMFAAAAIAAGVAMADVTSANIVGYANVNSQGNIYMAIGPTFMSVGGEGTFTLADVLKVGEGYDYNDDHFYLVNPEDCVADRDIIYFEGMGWFDMQNGEPVDDLQLDIGTGLQSSFASGNPFNTTSAGELHQDGYSVPSDGKVYQFIVNATGREITWQELSVTDGYDYNDDHFYVVNPEDCVADRDIIYFEGMGWFDMQNGEPVSDLPIAPGEGFQTSFASGNSFYINFPPSIPEAE